MDKLQKRLFAMWWLSMIFRFVLVFLWVMMKENLALKVGVGYKLKVGKSKVSLEE